MPCYHPLRAFPTGRLTDGGKTEYFIASHQETEIPPSSLSKKWPEAVWTFPLSTYIEIPCGHCIGCKIDHARRWAFRCLAESRLYKDNWFITFTYDDDHLPKDGEVHKRDLQLLFKRLRKAGFSFRYFACGEKGDTTKRPHYHVLFFGLALDASKFRLWKRGRFPLYNHADISKAWPYGFAVLGGVNFDTAQYVAKYVIKKYGDEDGFLLMSRRPGIGFEYFEDNYDPVSGSVTLGDGNGKSLTLSLPRSFKDKHAIQPIFDPSYGIGLKLFNSMQVEGWEWTYKDIEAYREMQESLAQRPLKHKI